MRRPSLLSVFLAVLVVLLLWQGRYPQRLWRRFRPAPVAAPPRFDAHPSFREQAPLQAAYGTHGARILMLGTSFTYRAAWNELLGRCDVLNRGVPSDVTAGLCQRAQPLFRDTSLKVAFIEGGGNDLPRGVPLAGVLGNLHRLADSFRAHGIRPVLTTTPLCSADQPRWPAANLRIQSLNAALRLYAPRWQVSLLDLSAALSGPAEILPTRYAVPSDGVHLTAPAYFVWRKLILVELWKMGL